MIPGQTELNRRGTKLDIKLSQRAQGIKPSPTLSVSARAAELKASGKDILSLAAGEPDFDTPGHIKEAGIQAIRNGHTKYTAVGGTVSLKQAVIDKFQRENGLEFSASEILVSCGAKHSIYNLTQALLNPGDEAIIPAPYWVSYPDMVRLAGAEPVIIKTGMAQQFKINAGQLRGAISDKTRLLILNSPSNPTGASYTREELIELGEILLQHPEILMASDDIYEHILWQGEFANIAMAVPALQQRTVVLNGVSKAYSMTGWRLGYAAGPAGLIKAMTNIQSQSTSSPASISQDAAEAALNGKQEMVRGFCATFRQRHDFCLQQLNAMPGVECLASQGTFYIFPNMHGIIDGLADVGNDIELAEYFLDHAGVAMVPGSAFGAPGHMRISFATSMEILEDAMQRIAGALEA